MIYITEGVRFRELRPEIYNIFPLLDDIFKGHNLECTITSANDRKHMTNSFHYKNLALDLRSHYIPNGREQEVIGEIKEAIGLDYDVILEDLDTPNEHIHLEFDPKG
jgi:hypothetical protein